MSLQVLSQFCNGSAMNLLCLASRSRFSNAASAQEVVDVSGAKASGEATPSVAYLSCSRTCY